MAKKAARKTKAAPDAQETHGVATMSGSEAIRQVIGGGVTKPSEIVEAVKRLHGLDVKASLVNNVKSKMSKSGSSVNNGLRGKRKSKGVITGNGFAGDAFNNGFVEGIRFVQACGGIQPARQVLDQLESLKRLL